LARSAWSDLKVLVRPVLKLVMNHLVRMSRGEKQGSDRARQQILANAFEALIGAIYLERGYDDAAAFIQKHILTKLDMHFGIRQLA
jgi:ribonuclease-3